MAIGPCVNLLLTENCPGRCPYCFNAAIREQRTGGQATVMTIEGFKIALEFLRQSQIDQVRLMGGEPLLHPDLEKLINLIYMTNEWKNLLIFTSGLFPKKVFQFFNPRNTHFVVNVNHPTLYPNDQWRTICRNLREAVESGFQVMLGYNIYQESFDYGFLIAMAREYGIDDVRVCVANPIGTRKTDILRGKQRRGIGPRILKMVEDCTVHNVSVTFDCILPVCLFSDEEYGRLGKLLCGNALRDGVCNPALDVRPDLTVHRCFAMGDDLKPRLEDFSNSREMADFFLERTDRFKWFIPPEGCESCEEYWNHKCQGDCLGFRLEAISQARKVESESEHLFNDAYAALERGESQLALECFRKAFKTFSYNSSAFCDYLYLLLKEGCTSEAQDLANRWKNVLRTEGRGKERLMRGLLAEALGNHEMAVSNYRASLNALKHDKQQYIRSRISQLIGDGDDD